MKTREEIEKRIQHEKIMGKELLILEKAKGLPKVLSTAHFQRAAMLEWVLYG